MNLESEVAEPSAPPPPPCIGVFDSGVGGLSVLDAIRRRLPGAPLVYLGDVAHAPYGARSSEEIVDRSLRIVHWLHDQGARLIVVACNTATAVAIDTLRTRQPGLTFVGVEPGVKPGVSRSRTRRIAVMVTAATANSPRLQDLIARHAGTAWVHVQPCPGLADAIERGVLGEHELIAVLQPHCDAIRAANVDTVVLGCTHYPFARDTIRALLGDGVTLIDTASAVAERTASLWSDSSPGSTKAPRQRVTSTGSGATMQLLMDRCPGLAHLSVEAVRL
jgi:glutamate racemase